MIKIETGKEILRVKYAVSQTDDVRSIFTLFAVTAPALTS